MIIIYNYNQELLQYNRKKMIYMMHFGTVPSKVREFIYNNLFLFIIDTSNGLVTCNTCNIDELDITLVSNEDTIVYVEDTNELYLRDDKVVIDFVPVKNGSNFANYSRYEQFDSSKPLMIKYINLRRFSS